MVRTIDATFDGAVLRPDGPLSLPANTRVRLIVETLPAGETGGRSFLRTARSLKLQGPPDWAANLEQYLYGDRHDPAR